MEVFQIMFLKCVAFNRQKRVRWKRTLTPGKAQSSFTLWHWAIHETVLLRALRTGHDTFIQPFFMYMGQEQDSFFTVFSSLYRTPDASQQLNMTFRRCCFCWLSGHYPITLSLWLLNNFNMPGTALSMLRKYFITSVSNPVSSPLAWHCFFFLHYRFH